MPLEKKSNKTWILTGVIAYSVLTLIFAGFIIFESVECIDSNDLPGTEECIEDVESKSAPYEAIFSLIQLTAIVVVVTLLVRHNNDRKTMIDQQVAQRMQQPPAPPQPPVQEQEDDKKPKA